MTRLSALIAMLIFLTGCASTPDPDPSILRVGISPHSPPLIYKKGHEILGVEADLARKISKELGRELVFVEVPWSKQIDYVEANKTDIIMSGMSVTSARRYRINFSKPYMIAGLTALFRRSDYAATGLVPSIIRHQNSVIGVVKDTSGEIFAKNNYVNAKIIVHNEMHTAVEALKNKKVNMVIHDAPMIWWIAAENEADLVAFFPDLMNNEALAWGISKNNSLLLEEVNLILDKIKSDGSGEKILESWFPQFGQ